MAAGETRVAEKERFGAERQNSDTFEAAYGGNYEFLARPFAIAPGVVIPVGGYAYTNTLRGQYNFGRQRRSPETSRRRSGTFYTGIS